MSGSREAILATLRRQASAVPRPHYIAPQTGAATANDLLALFAAKASAQQTEIIEISNRNSAPVAIASLLASMRAPLRLHMPQGSPLRGLPWASEADLAVLDAPPGMGAAAFSAADYAVAETGTLAFFSGPARPASWHFLPAREFVLLSRTQIVPAMEDVLALAAAQGMPSTLNFVTGPSRTGDIEQTLEIGAHGPREVYVLLSD